MFFRGAGSAARAYLESDHSHADEYYLENGGAVAEWSALDGDGIAVDTAQLDGTAYQAWVDWKDPVTGEVRGLPREEVRVKVDGELRITPSSPRFAEMTVNVDKSLSVAAALNPAVSAALDQAEAAAAQAMNTYMASNSVTRVGPRGAQRLVPVERLESVSVVHRSSRAGDPHRHIHVQWNTRVFAEGKWRGLHTGATLKQQGALRGVGEAAINSHAGLQRALAHAGFEFDASTGQVTNLHDQAHLLSKRARQIERNILTFEAAWRRDHEGQEPTPALRRQWDQDAWSHERPRKRKSLEHPEQRWVNEIREAGLPVDGFEPITATEPLGLDTIDRDVLRTDVLAAVEHRRSAWSIADLEGQVGVAVGTRGVTADAKEITAYTRTVAADIAGSLPVLEVDVDGQLPDWVRYYTSGRVLDVQQHITDSLNARGLRSGMAFGDTVTTIDGLNYQQPAGAHALASDAPLVVIEGAAGSGKTTMLGAAQDLARADGRHLVVVAPTLRAANEAAAATGADASSAHKLAYEYGYRWTKDGRWSRLSIGDVDEKGKIYRGPWKDHAIQPRTRIVVDEAGMVDQDLAVALITIADENGADLGFLGDRAQLPAVGRGGVLDIAVAASPRPLDLTEIHRFREPGYAELTIEMRERRNPGALFNAMHERGNIVLHTSDAEAWDAIGADVVAKAEAGASVAVAVTTNDTAAKINTLVQDAFARNGHTRKAGVAVSGRDDLQLRIGDRIMTRDNDSAIGVANRETWTVAHIGRRGIVTVKDGNRTARLPREYVEEHTHLAYASTEYGVQGATVDVGHGMFDDSTSAQALYVGATRGRDQNTLHVVAGGIDEARVLFTDALNRESGDRGVETARRAARRDVDGIVLPPQIPGVDTPQRAARRDGSEPTLAPQHPEIDAKVRAERVAYEGRLYAARLREWKASVAGWEQRHPSISVADVAVTIERLEHESPTATTRFRELQQSTGDEAVARHVQAWTADYATVEQARVDVAGASMFRRRTAEQTHETAQQAFRAEYGVEPTATPPKRLRDQWRSEAIAPGKNIGLDDARKHASDLRARLETLKTDPAPRPPAAPTEGSAAQEAAKDARYIQRQRHNAQQEKNRETPQAVAPKTPGPRRPER